MLGVLLRWMGSRVEGTLESVDGALGGVLGLGGLNGLGFLGTYGDCSSVALYRA